MKLQSFVRVGSALALVTGVGLVVAATSASATATKKAPAPAHVLYVETDAVSGNRVLTYLRASDGTVSFAGSYATGGLGAIAGGATADPLASQDALAFIDGGDELVTTTAGSNTLTVLSISGTSLKAVQTISSAGLFPASIAVRGNSVTALNAGGSGSIAEFSVVKGKLVSRQQWRSAA